MALSESFSCFCSQFVSSTFCTHCKLRYLNSAVQCVLISSQTSMLHSLASLMTRLCLIRCPAFLRFRCLRHWTHTTSCSVHMLSPSGKLSFQSSGMISMTFTLGKATFRNASQRLSYRASSLSGSTLSLMEFTRSTRLISVSWLNRIWSQRTSAAFGLPTSPTLSSSNSSQSLPTLSSSNSRLPWRGTENACAVCDEWTLLALFGVSWSDQRCIAWFIEVDEPMMCLYSSHRCTAWSIDYLIASI